MKSREFMLFVQALLIIGLASPVTTQADVAVLLSEQKARPREDNAKGRFLRFLFEQGAGNPGHTALYVSDFCLDGSYFKVRLCNDTDTAPGVVLSFIDGLSGGKPWIAVPPSLYFYGVSDISKRPYFATTFNTDLFAVRNESRSQSQKSETFAVNRISSLDLVRQTFLDGEAKALGGTSQSSDKVNLFLLSERDITAIRIYGDTRKEATVLLTKLNVSGFNYWNNCTKIVDDWMVAMFGRDVNSNPSAFEIFIENPRHYASELIKDLDRLTKRGTLKHPYNLEYYPQVTSDRSASLGFGTPSRSLYDPTTIGGIALWVTQPVVGGIALLGNLPTLLFKIDKRFRKAPTLAVAERLREIKAAKEQKATPQAIAALESEVVDLRNKELGSGYEWAMAHVTLAQGIERLRDAPATPAEIKWILVNSKANLGDLYKEVTKTMALRSQAAMVDGEHVLKIRFKSLANASSTKDTRGEDVG
ncbi:MAG: hypothetical protein K2X47_17400, partial [Bdellovibrionales bacterium]|nr:hypothetical protein [Bdellovibrionales bacterium]